MGATDLGEPSGRGLSRAEATISVGVGAVVLDDDGRILLVKHVPKARDFWGGQWMVPGGGLELGETLEEGIAREMEEETNLKVEVLRHVSTLDRIVREGDEVKIHVVYVDFLARPVSGELRPSSDVGAARWFSGDEIEANWDEIHVDTRRLLKKVGFGKVGPHHPPNPLPLPNLGEEGGPSRARRGKERAFQTCSEVNL